MAAPKRIKKAKVTQPSPPVKPHKKGGVWKYMASRDTLFATILVFLVIGSFVRFEDALGVLNPKDVTARDFDYNDLAFNLLGKFKNIPVDTRICIVDIGNMNREQIGNVVKKVNAAGPKVTGIDVLFGGPSSPGADSALTNLFAHDGRVVAACHLDSVGQPAGNFFMTKEGKKGYVDFTQGEQNVIRNVEPYAVKGDTTLSFSAAIVKTFDLAKYKALTSRKNETETINYTSTEDKFITIDGKSQGSDFSAVKNKIVLIGAIDTGWDFEDRHFTPLNRTIAGKSLPDMSGITIQANIIRMMLDENYINHWNRLYNWIFGFIICWVHMAFFIMYFIERHVWFHLAAKLAQFVSSVLFIYLGLFLFYDFSEQIDMSTALVAIVLAVDVLYFYEGAVVWLHEKKGYKTVFHHEIPN